MIIVAIRRKGKNHLFSFKSMKLAKDFAKCAEVSGLQWAISVMKGKHDKKRTPKKA